MTYSQAACQALREEMRIDPRVWALGEDLGPEGGVAGQYKGLQEEFGPERIVDTPISESAIVGISIGAAIRGYRPVAEMQFADFISCGFDQIVNQAATLRYRYGGRTAVPIVIRAPSGGNVGGGLYHSQNPEAWFVHRPGLKVVAPSNPSDMKGLLAAAIRDPDPVIVCEHKALFAEKGEVPEGEHVLDLGKATVVREGTDVTIVALAAMVPRSLAAAERLQDEAGISAEVLDLRTLVPLDVATILASVEKTSRLVTVEENPRLCGWGAEIASIVADEGFESLDAPIRRVAAANVPLPFADALEDEVIPSAEKLVATVKSLVAY